MTMTFEHLYQTYFDDVFRFAVWLTHDRSEAEDTASETFVRAWAGRDRLRTKTLKAYLLAIARNLVLDRRRKAANHEKLPGKLPDMTPDPHRRATARAELERVTRVLAELPEMERTALLLRTEHSLPYSEIARVLDTSEGAARVRVHRARRRLLEDSMKTPGGV